MKENPIGEIVIPDALRSTLRNATFVMWDSGVSDAHRIFDVWKRRKSGYL